MIWKIQVFMNYSIEEQRRGDKKGKFDHPNVILIRKYLPELSPKKQKHSHHSPDVDDIMIMAYT
jgi:hypothetical protein